MGTVDETMTDLTTRPAAPSTPTAPGRVVWLGTGVDYGDAWALQRRTATERADGRAPDTLLLLEHAAVYTAGRRSPAAHILGSLPAPLVETDRGGQVTYHGPGQLVGYPIVGLADRGFGPRSYVCALEAALEEALAGLGVESHTEEGLTGVWTARGKIAAIGVRITRGVTMHGFSLNVSIALSAYAPIVPCGIGDRPMTSVTELLGRPVAVAEVRDAVVRSLGRALGVRWATDGDVAWA